VGSEAERNARRCIFGPVPSRRLGRSLGVDPVPLKTCTYDCIYCQLGPTTNQTTQRRAHVPTNDIIAQFDSWLEQGGTADSITLAGSGEPTLHAELREIIRCIKRRTAIPVTVLTNGSLLWRDDVRGDIAAADLLIPSLDAALPGAFAQVNRPCTGLELERVLEGLRATRLECGGEMWLEVMLVAARNDSAEQLRALRRAIDSMRPDRIQINTVVRPPADPSVRPLSHESLQRARACLGPRAEIVAALPADYKGDETAQVTAEDVVTLLERRPCTTQDICTGLSIHPNEAAKYVAALLAQARITSEQRQDQTYYRAA
jgi:wyosine [tRNA(Phe)-imidazoG37] synthetase (radical SAM superfamily)